ERSTAPSGPVTEERSSCRTRDLPWDSLTSRASRGRRAACPGRHEAPVTHLGRAPHLGRPPGPRTPIRSTTSDRRNGGASRGHAEDDLVVAAALAGEDAGRVVAGPGVGEGLGALEDL